MSWKNHETGDSFSRTVETSQDRDELMNRAKSAMEKRSGQPSFSKKVRSGFWIWNDTETMNGKVKK